MRTLVLKNKKLFNTFYLGHPEQETGRRDDLVNSILNTTEDGLNISRPELRERFVGFAADGAYIRNLAIYKAFATKLEMTYSYANSVCLWDLAHKLELAASMEGFFYILYLFNINLYNKILLSVAVILNYLMQVCY